MADPAEHPSDLPACPSAQGSGAGLLPPELRGWMLLLAATGAVEQRLRTVVKDRLDVSHDEFLVLCLLAEQPGQGLRMTRIAELLGRPKTRLTYQIACLQHAGLVTRQSVCGDKRGVEVALTDRARRLLREASGALAETVTAALDHVMGPEQCAALSGLLPDTAARAQAHAAASIGVAARDGAQTGAAPEPAASD
ncbi:MarR family transcriptional regulator [Streptomyces sp. ID05-04B]|uniref:MarR family winged helix-turn-helix transcriptional regulator n=1 Tax=unclassified Streptomyces TaxID=2593676 RepID=UPI000D1B7086|nr:MULTISPECIES: MarR family transcriptional regulator [unclassified Streptomyces]AVV44826.1 MarR family transcriptional regulator [Streptomyces sp. P3]MDX5570770.1 MarR family transcriptional regulator [Streptomyces sp. ID05-04B]